MKIALELQQVLNTAYQYATLKKHEYLTPEHVLFSSLAFSITREIIEYCRVSPEKLKKLVEDHLEKNIPLVDDGEPMQTIGFNNVIERAVIHTESAQKRQVDVGDILVSIFDEKESYGAYLMKKSGIKRLMLLEAISHGPVEVSSEKAAKFNRAARTQTKPSNLNKPGKALQTYTIELTKLAIEGKLDPIIGRDEILERVMQILCRRLKNNPILVGEAGVGKTAIAEGLAQLIAGKKVPQILNGFQVFSLDMGSLIAGTRFRGDFEERIKNVLNELKNKKKVILHIDEIHTVIGAGSVSGGSLDASNLLKPALSRGDIRCIGSTTYDEYQKYFDKDHALSRRFQKIDIPEPTEQETIEILNGLKEKFETYHNVKYTDEAIKSSVTLSAQFINDRFLPDKAIDVIDEAGACKHVLKFKQKKDAAEQMLITDTQIEGIVSKIAKIPEKSVQLHEKDRLLKLESQIKKELYGQDDAVSIVVKSIKQARAGFRDAEKPVACFLFVGPTGVGKTELARLVSSSLGIALHRFDMSEYQEKHAVARLIGSPPGYIGFEEGGLLTDAIRKTPHAVLLLDEIEKAHADIFNILLQVMDYATLTDNTGRKADFRNVILIMTSNAGAREIGKEVIGFGDRIISKEAIGEAVDNLFSPEFRNRLDNIVLFNHLSEEIVIQVVDKELIKFQKQLNEKNVKLTVTKKCKKWLAQQGYSFEFGARGIARLVEDKIKSFFIDEVLFGRLTKGGNAKADIKNNEVIITIKE